MGKKLSIEFVKEQVRKLGHIPLFSEYVDSSKPLLCECRKHGQFTISYDSVKRILNGKSGPYSNGCKKCYQESARNPVNFIKDLFINKNLIPLFDKYKTMLS